MNSLPLTPQARLARQGMRSTLIGIGVNILLAATKGMAGVLGHSYALIADAVESSMDIASSLIVWMGLRYSVKPPDDNQTCALPICSSGMSSRSAIRRAARR